MLRKGLFFRSKDGTRLYGVLERPDVPSKSCIILCHGITVDRDELGVFTELAGRLIEYGFHTFRFDFRGHGRSGGAPAGMTVAGEVMDLEAAYGVLRRMGYRRFGIVAASFGGGPAAFFCPKHEGSIGALVLWNSLLEYSDISKKWLTKRNSAMLMKKGFFVRNGFRIGRSLMKEMGGLEPWKELKKLGIPILFIHGDKDTVVPYTDSVRYSRMLGAGLKTIPGAGHGFHDRKRDSALADQAAIDFFRKNIA